MSALLSEWMSNYQGLLAAYMAAGVLLLSGLSYMVGWLIPTIKRARTLNVDTAKTRMERGYYVKTQSRSMLGGSLAMFVGYVFVAPFCINAEPPVWWSVALEVFVVLMFYDFYYYLTHRFLFHDGPLKGPLLHVHAIHHQNKNPCRKDSNYLHPLETIIGIALYFASLAALTAMTGTFNLVSLIISSYAFLAINTHNHDLVGDETTFPFRYWKYAAHMHHVHHSRFTSGNYATISLFYDWLFGTLDHGEGYGKSERTNDLKKAS